MVAVEVGVVVSVVVVVVKGGRSGGCDIHGRVGEGKGDRGKIAPPKILMLS